MNQKIGVFVLALGMLTPMYAVTAAAQEGDGTRVDDRVERREARRAVIADEAAEHYEGDGTRVDDRVERRENRRAVVAEEAAEHYEGDGTRVDDRVERREIRRDTRQGE